MRLLITLISICGILFSCQAQEKKTAKKEPFTVVKTEAEWKAQLSDQEFYVLRKAGTERPFTGEYNKHYKDGIYHCKACNTPLYKSETKFDSGTGWPSFYDAIDGNIRIDIDHKLGYARKELLCNTCGGHLGHVFNDGPKPTGKRHCINSVSLQFKPAK